MSFSPQYLVAATLALLALVAYSASALVSRLIAAQLRPPVRVELIDKPPPIPKAEERTLQHYAMISERDIFNSRRQEAPAPPPPAPPAPPPNVKLLGVVVHDQPKMSQCVIEDARSRKQNIYRVGDRIEETDATVRGVDWGRCVLSRAGGEMVLQIESPQQGGAPGPMAAIPGRAAPPPRPQPASDDHIRQTGENEFAIDRSEVDRAFENMSELLTQVRAVPHFEGGKSVGFRLFAIRQGSLFDKIGLKNGDVIQKINGNDLSDPGKALALMQELRNERDLTVEIQRNRQPQTLSYQVR